MASNLSLPSVFDLSRINDQWGSQEDDIYRAVLRIFADEGQTLCAEMRLSLTEGRLDMLARAAHTLKAAAANVGASRLSECAGAIEAAAESSKRDGLKALLVRVETAWRAVRAELDRSGSQT